MRNIFTRKRVAVAAVAAAIAVGAGSALAYWSTTGSGTGTSSTTSGVSNTLHFVTSTINPMYPGDSAQTFTVTVNNTDAHQRVHVVGVSAYITTNHAGCDGTDFLLDGSSTASDLAHAVALDWTAVELGAAGSVSPSDTSATSGLDTIQFNDKGTLQDACKGATVTLNYSAN